MRYLLLTALLLTNCQPQDVDPTLVSEPITTPTPEPEPEPEPETPMLTMCLPQADLVTMRDGGMFYWNYGEPVEDSVGIVDQCLRAQGFLPSEYTLTIEYSGKHHVNGVQVDPHIQVLYGAKCATSCE